MSNIAGELARVREAFDKPTLRLLDRKWAPFVLAVFKASFSRDRRSVPAENLHTQVDAYLSDLRERGEKTPQRNGRALCVEWMNDQWLYREAGDDGEEQYSLTSHALEAISLVDSLSRDRALISESRLTMIVDTVRNRAIEANPDREERLRRLDRQIAELNSERDRVADGGEISAATEEQMLEGYANLVDLIGQLPSDFKRVEESVAAMHRQIITDFRNEERPISEVLDEYLAKTDTLMSATAEGRAFEGAFVLLRNDELLEHLKNDLETILDHPFASTLTSTERRSFLATVGMIRKGIDDVLTQRNGLTTTLRDHIVNHDVVKDRELERLLRDLNKELASWMETAGPRSTVPVELMPATLNIHHLREKLNDPAAFLPPPPLVDVSTDAPPPPTLDDIKKQGGPQLHELRDALVSAFASGTAASVGAAFNQLQPDLRRPVEILGLLQIATQVDAVTRAAEQETFESVRPDGSIRSFTVPRMTLDPTETAAIAALNYGTTSD